MAQIGKLLFSLYSNKNLFTMKKEPKNEKKLSLKKLQIVKIANPNKIFGGTRQNVNDCGDPNNASNHQGGFDTSR
ncbi:hypothetical protein A0O34_21725 [Chryseobacterium glaciei]|uniref:Uncharacterized protein n=2 Tax=Chryseobacterium glaciei TaxID=1685010 RepID=A0A172Y1J8_9FLAO|nr:hypothetical protein A0O34_21725 [Chryseobacterium glaciei]